MNATMLFEGRDLFLRANTGAPAGPLIVTFSSWVEAPEYMARGFAEARLNNMGVNNLVFVSSRNHWWQTSEMPHAIAAAQEHIRGLAPTRTAGYGSSMGGYGALLYSRELAFADVLALSPQFSVDARKVPFESRWREEAARLQFTHDDMDGALQSAAVKYVLFDNQCEDRSQMDLMRGHALRKLTLPYCGHNLGPFLQSAGQLKPLLASLVAGNLASSLPEILQQCRRRRSDYGNYRNALLYRVESSPAHRRLARRLARSFVEKNPDDVALRQRLARYCLRDGHIEAARQHAEIALRLSDGKPGIRQLLTDIERLAATRNSPAGTADPGPA